MQEKIGDLIHAKLTNPDKHGNRLNILFIRIGDDKGAIEFFDFLDNHGKTKNNVDTKPDDFVWANHFLTVLKEAIFEDQT